MNPGGRVPLGDHTKVAASGDEEFYYYDYDGDD